MRLNRYLAACGLGSRRGCEQIILDGRVTIDGDRCSSLSRRVSEGERVKVDGKAITVAPEQSIAFFKPRGLVTSREDELGRETIYSILPEHLQDLRYVGRLDLESEGLLVLTRDGDLAQALSHPSSRLEKEYLVTLDQAFDKRHTDRLLRGIALEEGRAVAKSFQVLSPRRVQVILTQGMKRQIRRMFEALGYRVRKLVRVRVGGLTLGNLKPGRWRSLTDSELDELRRNPEAPAIQPAVKAEREDAQAAKRRRAQEYKMAADRRWRRGKSGSQRKKRDRTRRGRGR